MVLLSQTVPNSTPTPTSQVCFLEFSEIVCDLSCAFYSSHKQQQAGEGDGAGDGAGGGAGGRLGKAPSGEQQRVAEEVTKQESHMSTSSQQEGEESLDYPEEREGGAHWEYVA